MYKVLFPAGRSCFVRHLSSSKGGRLINNNNNGGSDKRRKVFDTASALNSDWSPSNGNGSVNEGERNRVFKPVSVLPPSDEMASLGKEIAGKMSKQQVLKTLNAFFNKVEIRALSKSHGLDDYLLLRSFNSFRKYCTDVSKIPTELYIVLSDVIKGALVLEDIFPHFLSHARKVFPHLECLDDLKNIGDIRDPTHWYPEARTMNRKIFFHSGPTNSGKTFHALERFFTAKSGVYCGPLKMLAMEVRNKSLARGTPCDLITGEERLFAREDGEKSNHVSCTVEMTNTSEKYEVCVIDEIQLLRDIQRGWAWTRALLGVQAEEIHVCGEGAAIDLVKELMIHTGEEVEVMKYNRLTNLVIEDRALVDYSNVQDGDCIVCFNKQDIYNISRYLEKKGRECAVIYGSLPPAIKLNMAEKFNDPNHPCKVMVATDAVGMGLNLNIRRIIFNSITKYGLNSKGEKEMDWISVSQALQIAGRAGRYNTQWETGYVTTYRINELKPLKKLLKSVPEELTQARILPTFEQIELYAFHLPHASLSNIIDIFISLAEVDDELYALCPMKEMKFLAEMLSHIKLPLKVMYTFVCAPVDSKRPFVCTMYLKFARQFSQGEVITFDWLCHQIGWPFSSPKTLMELAHLENVHDCFEIYLWLHMRYPDMFPDEHLIRSLRDEVGSVIESGVNNIVQLLLNSESGVSSSVMKVSDDVEFQARNASLNRFNEWHHKKIEVKDVFDYNDKNNIENDDKKGGTISDQLINQGLITKSMLEDLKRELTEEKINKSKK